MKTSKRFRFQHGTAAGKRFGGYIDVQLNRAFNKKCKQEKMTKSDRIRRLIFNDCKELLSGMDSGNTEQAGS